MQMAESEQAPDADGQMGRGVVRWRFNPAVTPLVEVRVRRQPAQHGVDLGVAGAVPGG